MTRRDVSEAELDSILGIAGRGVAETDGGLREALVAAGMPDTAASVAARQLDEGASVDDALSVVGFFRGAAVPASVVVDRVREVAARHYPVSVQRVQEVAPAPSAVKPGDPRLTTLRYSLIVARQAQYASTTRAQAVVYADACIAAVTERALREAWSPEQVLTRLDNRLAEERARVRQPVGGGGGPRPSTIRETGGRR